MRIPMELFLKSREDGTLQNLLGEYGGNIPESVFEMITGGVVGPIVNVSIEVVEYDY